MNQSQSNDVIDQMFQAGAHFGYSRTRRHPSVKPYIFGVKNEVEILDLEKTTELVEKARTFVFDLAKRGKQILFVGTKSEAKKVVTDEANRINQPYMTERWIGGLLTNHNQVSKRVARLLDLRDKESKGELSVYTKKERSLLAKEVKDLERFFAGVVNMNEMPGALFVVDSKHEDIAVKEAKKLNIPVMGLANSDCDLTLLDYPIVGNDSSRASIALFTRIIADAYAEAVRGNISKE